MWEPPAVVAPKVAGSTPVGHSHLTAKTQPPRVVAEGYGSSKLLNTFPKLNGRASKYFELRPEIQITISLQNYKLFRA